MPEITVRRKTEVEPYYYHWYIKAPGTSLDKEPLKYTAHSESWTPGKWNYTQEEYGRFVSANDGYLMFANHYWDREPDQDIFDAFCLLLKQEWNDYQAWWYEQDKKWGNMAEVSPLEPFVLPKGTGQLMIQPGGPENPIAWKGTYWKLTDRVTTIALPE